MHRSIRRTALIVTASVALLIAAGASVLAFPEPFYDYGAHAGRLSLYSDRPFDNARAEKLLADVERRLALAPKEIADTQSRYRIFVSHAPWRRRLTFLWNDGAGGVNYYPLGGAVFLRASNIDRDRLLRLNGEEVEPPRTLAYFAAHEIAHSLIGQHVGAIANWRLRLWIREGLCDYVGFGGDVDIDGLARKFRARDPDLDPKQSGTYARYRLLVAFYLQREKWSVDRLLGSQLSQADAEKRLRASSAGRR